MPISKSSRTLIRLATSQDRKDIIALEKLAIYNSYNQDYTDKEKSLNSFDCERNNLERVRKLMQNIQRIRFTDEVIFVAEKNNQIVGFASLLSYRQILRTLYVRPNIIDRDIETKLLNAIETAAISQRIQTLNVTSSITEKAFYQSRGYREIAVSYLERMGLLVPYIAMEKKLTHPNHNYFFLKNIPQFLAATIPNLFFLLFLI